MASFKLEVPRAALVITDPQVDQAALVTFRYIADAHWSTDEAVRQI